MGVGLFWTFIDLSFSYMMSENCHKMASCPPLYFLAGGYAFSGIIQ